jgi:hypothetical protein
MLVQQKILCNLAVLRSVTGVFGDIESNPAKVLYVFFNKFYKTQFT